MAGHTYNSSYLAGWDIEDHSTGPAIPNSSWDTHLQNNYL
jgi:hypothetical protein